MSKTENLKNLEDHLEMTRNEYIAEIYSMLQMSIEEMPALKKLRLNEARTLHNQLSKLDIRRKQ